ncbi:hypothetical protein GF1_22470 [Desulfolithobacter dissulfuricans]|uniref:Cell division protein ZapB n=1 Tax=Desulfolithobacter dissulfuricans TaxID=2795293 RepID=A0A915U205_9BACT|nr:cell division protein ZapB [Desulfolithobacter dissulfuricans]BCO09871.1 hypothetical protein GF1_22470 [Desulfolithobacter dissulfuricans]
MENNAELIRLEQFVDKLLSKYNDLKERFFRLEDTLRDRDAEIVELKATIEELQTERSEVGQRVSGLIDRIARWESEQDEEPAGEDVETGNESGDEGQAGVQGSLFRAEEQ